MKVSCACRSLDAVDAAELLVGRSNGQPKLLLQRAREDAAHRMALPPRGARHLIDGCPLGSPQHGNDLILLRWPFRVGLRFWVWQGLDGRPQLIDQRPAVADLLPFFALGPSIPQRPEPLGAECVG